jgi:hypothetical protein
MSVALRGRGALYVFVIACCRKKSPRSLSLWTLKKIYHDRHRDRNCGDKTQYIMRLFYFIKGKEPWPIGHKQSMLQFVLPGLG